VHGEIGYIDCMRIKNFINILACSSGCGSTIDIFSQSVIVKSSNNDLFDKCNNFCHDNYLGDWQLLPYIAAIVVSSFKLKLVIYEVYTSQLKQIIVACDLWLRYRYSSRVYLLNVLKRTITELFIHPCVTCFGLLMSCKSKYNFLHIVSWLDPLFWIGYRRELKQEDLYATPQEARSQHLLEQFDKYVCIL